MREVTVKLDAGRKEKEVLENEATSESENSIKASRAEVSKISKRISKIDKRRDLISESKGSL